MAEQSEVTYSVARSYTFSAAHRLEGHPKCGRLHGHNYKVTVELWSLPSYPDGEGLEGGMVMDFSAIDTVLKPFIDMLDHRYLVSTENIEHGDPYLKAAQENTARHDDYAVLPVQRTTAELLAAHIGKYVSRILYKMAARCEVGAVEVQETERSAARAAIFSYPEEERETYADGGNY